MINTNTCMKQSWPVLSMRRRTISNVVMTVPIHASSSSLYILSLSSSLSPYLYQVVCPSHATRTSVWTSNKERYKYAHTLALSMGHLPEFPSRGELMAKEEDGVFSFPSQLSPLHFSDCSTLDWHNDLQIHDQYSALGVLPLMEIYPADPLFLSLNLPSVPNPNFVQEDWSHVNGNEFDVWNYENSTSTGFDNQNQPLLLCGGDNGEECAEEKKVRRCGEDRTNSTKMLSRETVSQYFYMPITQAAKQLNVGLTLLKKRCRELGIRRWPHRKLMSLQNLIKHLQELEKEGGKEAEGKLRVALEILEEERKVLEEVPDVQLEDRTKRLRQACFKANYKKKKLKRSMEPQSSSSGNHASMFAPSDYGTGDDDDDDEEIKSLLAYCFSSSDMAFKI